MAQKKPLANDPLKYEAIADIQAKYDEYKQKAFRISYYTEVGYKKEKHDIFSANFKR